MRLGICGFVGAREGAVEPVSEPLAISEKGNAAKPERPVPRINIQFEVCGPRVIVDVLHG
jgi:hypothetical protein